MDNHDYHKQVEKCREIISRLNEKYGKRETAFAVLAAQDLYVFLANYKTIVVRPGTKTSVKCLEEVMIETFKLDGEEGQIYRVGDTLTIKVEKAKGLGLRKAIQQNNTPGTRSDDVLTLTPEERP
jgi:hypothetical protein